MERLTYPRATWAAVAREIQECYRDTAPPGLVARIEALLRETPAGWAGQPCALELDASSADVVRAVTARLQDETTSSPGAITQATEIVRDHQRGDGRPIYRAEHRDDGRTIVVGRTADVHARQAELSHHAARLMAAGATGDLILVEEGTGAEVARRSLNPERPGPAGAA